MPKRSLYSPAKLATTAVLLFYAQYAQAFSTQEIDSRLLCDELIRIGDKCYKHSNGQSCFRNWARQEAKKILLAEFNKTPEDSDWNELIDTFDHACYQACSQKHNNQIIRTSKEFCGRLGVKANPPLVAPNLKLK